MKSIYSYFSPYVRSLEKERDELLNRLLEANQIRPLYDYGTESETETPKEPIQAYPMGQQRALNELSRLSREDAIRMHRQEIERREKVKANGGDNAPE